MWYHVAIKPMMKQVAIAMIIVKSIFDLLTVRYKTQVEQLDSLLIHRPSPLMDQTK